MNNYSMFRTKFVQKSRSAVVSEDGEGCRRQTRNKHEILTAQEYRKLTMRSLKEAIVNCISIRNDCCVRH